MPSKFQHRGLVPPAATANALRDLIAEVGDWEASRRCGHSRLTVVRIAAGLPISPTTLADIEARLSEQNERYTHTHE